MDIRLASECTFDSVVDGPGIRTVIWTQGCPHNCKECHNPGTHDYNGGFLKPADIVISDILKVYNNVTFSGGDPFAQPKECSYIGRQLKSAGLNLWSYSGWTFEELLERGKNEEAVMSFLNVLDRLVDGRFKIENRTLDLPYRGSSNQRIIDVQESLRTGKTIVDNSIREDIFNPREPGIFI